MKKALASVVAGKLMLNVGKATAGAQGKTGTTQLSPLVLDEVGTPKLEIPWNQKDLWGLLPLLTSILFI